MPHQPRIYFRSLILLFLLVLPALAARAQEAGQIAPKLQPFVESHTLAGAVVLVANKEKVLDVETIGFADIAGGKRMQPDSVFWIASMSKPITATALMLLVDDDKVKLDDPVSKYLPEFKDIWLAVEQDAEHVLLKKPVEALTVRRCLSHTSGMPFKSMLEQPTLDGLLLRDAVRSYVMTPLVSEPGAKYQYSNAGINTAGRIIEVVSGMPYEDFLDQRLFAPLGMKDTTFWPNEEQLTRLAKPYKPTADKSGLEETTIGQLQYPLNNRARQPMPGGGLFSTAGDLASFCRMLLNGGELDGKKYLSAESLHELSSHQIGDLPGSYGLGFSTEKRSNGTFGHGGALSTNMTIDRENNLACIYLVQHAGYGGTEGGKIQPTFMQTARERYGKK